jgi:hypothetical protein
VLRAFSLPYPKYAAKPNLLLNWGFCRIFNGNNAPASITSAYNPREFIHNNACISWRGCIDLVVDMLLTKEELYRRVAALLLLADIFRSGNDTHFFCDILQKLSA